MTSGIYEIVHIPSGCRYIGHSKHIEWRWQQHRADLDCGDHVNTYLQNAWNKYGCDSFVFRIVEECSVTLLLDREQAYIDLSWGIPGALFNIAREAHRPPGLGRPHSEETKKKISQANRGKPGRPITAEQQAKMIEGRRRKPKSPRPEEWRKKISEALVGKTHETSQETRAKISAAKKGKPGKSRSPESIAKQLATRLANRLAEKEGR